MLAPREIEARLDMTDRLPARFDATLPVFRGASKTPLSAKLADAMKGRAAA